LDSFTFIGATPVVWNVDNGGFEFRTYALNIFNKKYRFMSGIRHPGCLNIMQQLKVLYSLARNCPRTLAFVVIIFISGQSFCQKSADWKLERMPADLETDFALSALPPHLRDACTVYLLDPEKGYYIARQGTNGFSTFVNRTEWEWAEFVQDTYGAISYDEEGTKTYMPVFLDVAKMRASGKYSPSQIRDIIIKGVKDGKYKAPSRTGVSYMLAPLLRTHPGPKGIEVVNMVMPHYMFYAPRVDNTDIGGVWDAHSPYAINSGDILDKEHSIFNYIILPAGDTEKAKIIEENKDLLRRLAEYKSCLKVDPGDDSHHH
jgi:hypothetical protein